MMTIEEPASTASLARRQSSSIARFKALPPIVTSNSAAKLEQLSPKMGFVNRSKVASDRMGLGSLIIVDREHCSPRSARDPRSVFKDITTRSRIGSMAGLVTCANRCLKYEYNSRGFED